MLHSHSRNNFQDCDPLSCVHRQNGPRLSIVRSTKSLQTSTPLYSELILKMADVLILRDQQEHKRLRHCLRGLGNNISNDGCGTVLRSLHTLTSTEQWNTYSDKDVNANRKCMVPPSRSIPQLAKWFTCARPLMQMRPWTDAIKSRQHLSVSACRNANCKNVSG